MDSTEEAMKREAAREKRCAYRRRWYAANRDRIRERSKAWRAANRERILERDKAWRAKSLKNREAKRLWRLRNPEKLKAYQREWLARNPEHQRAYYQRNLEYYRTKNRAYYAKHRERLLAQCRAYGKRVRRIAKAVPQYEELRKRALLNNEFYSAADRVISRALPPFMRADVISMIVLDAIEGKLAVADIPAAARSYVSRCYRENSSSFGTWSLDGNIPGTDIKAIDAVVYEGAGVGFDGEEFAMPETEEDMEAFIDEMVG